MAAPLNGSVPAYSLLILGLGLGALVILFGGLAYHLFRKNRRQAREPQLKPLSSRNQYSTASDIEKGSHGPDQTDSHGDDGHPWPINTTLDEIVANKPWPATNGNAASVAGTTEPELRTFVATDIEGSTGLWEWNGSVMDAAQEAHDTCLRRLLYTCNGEEVHTEGDAFCCAFGSAVDAVVWCLMVQQALLEVDWAPELLQEAYAREETVVDADGVVTVVFRGLRVRMGVHTSTAWSLAPHAVTGQRMYRGSGPEFADKLCGMGKGGQVLLCARTYQLVCKRLGEIAVALDAWQQEQGGQGPAAAHRLNSYGQLPDYLHLCRGSNCSSPASPENPSTSPTRHDEERPGSAPLDSPLTTAALNGCPTLSHGLSVPERFTHRHHAHPPRFVPLPPLHSNPQPCETAIATDPPPSQSPSPLPDPSLPYTPSPTPSSPAPSRAPSRAAPSPTPSRGRSPLCHPRSPSSLLLQDLEDDPCGLDPATLRERSFDIRASVQHSSPSTTTVPHSPFQPAAISPFHPAPISPFHPTRPRPPSSARARRGSLGTLPTPIPKAGVRHPSMECVDQGDEGGQLGEAHLEGLQNGGRHARGRSAGSRLSVDGMLLPSSNVLQSPALLPSPTPSRRSSQVLTMSQPLLMGRWATGDFRLTNSLSASMDLTAALDTRFGSVNSEAFFGRAGSKMQRLVSELTEAGAATYSALPLLVDMGKHALQWGSSKSTSKSSRSDDQRPANTHIVMVVSSALRGRLQHWPGPLDSKQQQDAGYFDAPCTLSTAKWVGCNIPSGSRPFVTFGFCSICPETAGRLPEDKLDTVTEAFTQVVRSTLSLCGGYECQERGGTFMLAFKSMRFALEWSLVFQLALMQVDWDGVMDEEGSLQELLGAEGQEVFRGIKGRVGLMHGEVVKVTPHATTGRADYFGPVLNRAARVHSASHGGQVLAEAFATYKAVREWQAAYSQAEDVGSLSIDTHHRRRLNEPLGPVAPKVLQHIKKKLQHSRSIATQHTANWHPPESTEGRSLRPGRSFSTRDNVAPTSSLRTLNKQSSWGSEGRSEAAAQLLAGTPLVPRQRLAVHVYDRGTYQFKGVDIFIPTVSVLPADLEHRESLFPSKPLSSKAKLAKPGGAAMQRVFVEIPDVTQVELLRPTLSPCASSDQPLQVALQQ